MKVAPQLFILLSGTILLSSCASMERQESVYRRYTSYQPDYYSYNHARYYAQSYESGANYGDETQVIYTNSNADAYDTTARVRPTSHKDLDSQWVKSQNAQSYTIELADSDKASQVAGQLYKAPKTDRRAQVKYYQNGKTAYKGLYGSYSSYEEAEKALNNLPADLKQGANIKHWSAVQSNI